MGTAILAGLLLLSGAASGSSARTPRPVPPSGPASARATRFGHKGGIVLSRTPHVFSHASSSAPGPRPAGPSFNGEGSGDLEYNGGPVMRQNTVRAIFWIPSGYSVSANYESQIDGFFQNVAGASGRSDNVYSVGAQYGDTTGPGSYQLSFGGSVVDTDPFPANGCTDGPLPVCMTDGQLQGEIDKVVSAHGWQTGMGNEFFIFTPLSVGSCFTASDGPCAYSYYCAYHSSFTSGAGSTVLYANVPYAALPAASGTCDDGERPNGDDADATINLVSHEEIESITDPLLNAWYDSSGNEIGDKCAWIFGQPLGSINGSGTNTDYNEQIGTGKYWLQQEWSNESQDPGTKEIGTCVQRDMPQVELTGPGDGNVSASGGLTCGSTPCDLSAQVGTTQTFTAHPSSGSRFVGWQGACSGTGACTVSVAPRTSVIARFETSQLPAGWAVEPVAPPAGFDPLPAGDEPEWTFYRIAASADGTERATTLDPNPGGCPVGPSGIYMQRQTSSGWAADGTITAPSVGGSEFPLCSEFGAEISLSADGSTLLASQIPEEVNTNNYVCATFVYERGSTGWNLAATLFPPGVGPTGTPTVQGCDYFGINSTLSADGRRAVVLSVDHVDVYVRNVSGWTLEQNIALPAGDNCYYTIGPPRISISGDGSRLLVGAPDCTISGQQFAGRVYDYDRSGSTWSLAQTIDTPDPIYNSYFGTAVTLSADGKTAAIATQLNTGLPSFAGAAYIYEHDGTGWHQRVRLTTPAPDQYGLMTCPYVSGDGSQIVCSAFDTVGFDPAQGSLYEFDRPGSSWTSAPTPLRFFVGNGHPDDNLGAGHYSITWYMPASVAVPAAGGDLVTTIAAGNVGLYDKKVIGYEFTTAPVVDSYSPAKGLAGTQVTLKGRNFSGATTVTFGGVPAASFTVDSATEITATVSAADRAGTIEVTTAKGHGWSSGSFSPLPAIQLFSPASGVAGTQVTITGTNLADATNVDFDGIPAGSSGFSVKSATQISVTVPPWALPGELTVVTPAGSASTSTPFEPMPAIRSLSPGHGRARARVVIHGTNLSGASSVRFDGRAARFAVSRATSIVARVPKQAGIGRVTVTTSTGRATSSKAFEPLPSISSIRPRSAVVGARITITGANLRGATAVTFHGRKARFHVVSPTRIVAVVPRGATSGRIVLRTRAGKTASRALLRVARR